MGKPISVLLIEDCEDDALLIMRELRKGGYELTSQRVETEEALKEALGQRTWDVVLSDHNLPRFSSIKALQCLKDKELDIPFIIISGTMGEEAAVLAMKSGAHDYLLKGHLGRLARVVDRELREASGRAERRRLEEQLHQSQKMEAIGQLAGGIAHDLNNLLTAILSPAQMVYQHIPKTDPNRKWLEMIMHASNSAASLVKQLLTFSRKSAVDRKVIDINGLVRKTGGMLRRIIGEQVKIVLRLDSAVGNVFADRSQLEQLLINLCVNAKDAMPEGGTLTLETKTVTLSPKEGRENNLPAGEYILAIVGDTGVGMSKEVQAKIFEPFFTTKKPGKGTGLGLAICLGIVQKAGGTILVKSRPGAGSVFKIFLPKADRESLAEAPNEDEPIGGDETILLVEDEPMVRDIAAAQLEEQGFKVLKAGNGEEGLRILKDLAEVPVHLLLTDLAMPGMGGRELAQRVKELKPEIHVLFMSAYMDEDESEFIMKPFTSWGLCSKVREILDASAAPAKAFRKKRLA